MGLLRKLVSYVTMGLAVFFLLVTALALTGVLAPLIQIVAPLIDRLIGS